MISSQPTGPAVDRIRRALLECRRNLLRDVDGLEDDLRLLEASHPAESDERGQREATIQLLDRLQERDRHEPEDIQRALGKIATGTYGWCERCRRPISLRRLEAVPESRYCIDCERTLEAAACSSVHVRDRRRPGPWERAPGARALPANDQESAEAADAPPPEAE